MHVCAGGRSLCFRCILLNPLRMGVCVRADVNIQVLEKWNYH